jgi:DNA invertase Pin-like site-specific DNA recombinase
MVDSDSGKIVDMIASREPDDVSGWLKEFPNISIVSRDGSFNYATAITQSHPQAIQVSDRFHIIKNLNERVVQRFHKIFKSRIVIPLTSQTAGKEIILGTGNRADKIRLVKEMYAKGRSLVEIQASTGMSGTTIKQYLKISDQDIPCRYIDSREQEHLEATEKLKEKVAAVRQLKKEGVGIRAIARETGLSLLTVKGYLSPSFVAVNGQYGKHREGKLAPYRDLILRLKTDGLAYSQIHKTIQDKGYTGGEVAIRAFIARERRIRNEIKAEYGNQPVELIDKKWLLRLIYQPIDTVKGITKEQLAAVIRTYPETDILFNTIKEFKAILNDNRPRRISWWIRKVSALNIEELNRFINGMVKDLPAIKNAITYANNNGIAEGSVNKVKVLKRIMYGRCSFDLLRKKVLMYENLFNIN